MFILYCSVIHRLMLSPNLIIWCLFIRFLSLCFLVALHPLTISRGIISMLFLEWPGSWKWIPTGQVVSGSSALSRCSRNLLYKARPLSPMYCFLHDGFVQDNRYTHPSSVQLMFWLILILSPVWWITTSCTTLLGSAAGPRWGHRQHICLCPILPQLRAPTKLSPVTDLVSTVPPFASRARMRWLATLRPFFILHLGGWVNTAGNLRSLSHMVRQFLPRIWGIGGSLGSYVTT